MTSCIRSVWDGGGFADCLGVRSFTIVCHIHQKEVDCKSYIAYIVCSVAAVASPPQLEVLMSFNRTTLAELQELATDEVARLPVAKLQKLVEDVAVLLSRAKSLDEKINGALDLRFSEQAKAARASAGKDTGRIRLVDDDFEIVADSPKAVVWDQATLSKIAAIIRDEWNENPTDDLIIKYGVAESKF